MGEDIMTRSGVDKEKIEMISQQLLELTGQFCDQYLDDEYKQLCEKVILKMKRKRQVPFLLGRVNVWAASIIYALGQINFLFDRSFKPYVSADDIANYFSVSKSTIGQKAKQIRDMFNISYWDSEFSTRQMSERNPLKNMVMVDGMILPADVLPPEIQEELRRRGII
jgi:hypothetical protein